MNPGLIAGADTVNGVRTPLPVPRSIDELRPGHIVFCSRPSVMQRLNDSVGDEWRHVGIIVETDDGLFMAGFGRLAQFSLMPLSSLWSYPKVGVASLFADPEEVRAAEMWTMSFVDKATEYPTSAVPMAGLLSYGRTQRSAVCRKLIVSICTHYSQWMTRRHRDDIVFICSTFVASAINAAAPSPVEFDLAGAKGSDRAPKAAHQVRNDLLARWLATPSDLWRALPAACRGELRGHGGTTSQRRQDRPSPSMPGLTAARPHAVQ